ncbi:peptide ABC transporter substrate-binding protein [Candidatus Kaiserbacteria bacterium]|nr:peptide ABC transporter substrate-binding protein [Candidatus Kaiserbacteria bacterium]
MISDSPTPSSPGEDLKTKLFRHRSTPLLLRFEKTHRALSPGERLTVFTLGSLLVLSALAIFAGLSGAAGVEIPSRGGTLSEGVMGPVRFVNPLLALSGPDKDLTVLVYSGLMRALPSGELIPDLAKSYDISEDGTVYTFTLRDGITFHDGTPLTAADVLFTVERARNPDFKSARRADWEGVAVAAPDPRTVVFTLPHAYAPFLENTTLGILPKTLWNDVSAEEFPFHPLNTRPIGSGPYRYKDLSENSTGSITRYELSSFNNFALGRPYLEKITFLFFPSEEDLLAAFNTGRIGSMAGVSPLSVEDVTRHNTTIARATLPRTFAVFLNQSKNALLAEGAVRAALDAAIDKEHVIDEVLKGFGVALESPIPPQLLGSISRAVPEPLTGSAEVRHEESGKAEDARDILSRGGWIFDKEDSVWTKKKTTLEFTLVTADEPELSATAELLASMWRDAGIKVNVHVYPLSELNSIVIRPREYEAILFGEVVGRSLDLFAFWHSSQRNDPGLNLALYTNSKADALLTRARETTSRRERVRLYEQFEDIVKSDMPAVFLYAPEFIYIVPEVLQGVALGALTDPSERFLNVHEWYTDTELVWNIFTNKISE